MLVTAETLHAQQKRIHRARRILKAADKAHAIGVHHARTKALLPLDLSDPGSLDHYLAAGFHAQIRADRAFALARALYARHGYVLAGVA